MIRTIGLTILALVWLVSAASAEPMSARKWLEYYNSPNEQTRLRAVFYYMGLADGVAMMFICPDRQSEDPISYRTAASKIADKIQRDVDRNAVEDGLGGHFRSYVLMDEIMDERTSNRCQDARWLEGLKKRERKN
jgi:hypothetical protein